MVDSREEGAYRAPPTGLIDRAHLTRQTQGDAELEREVLALFLEQALLVRDKLTQADAEARRRLAHSLVGAARAIGAFALADCAAELEAYPYMAGLAERLSFRIDEVRVVASKLIR